MSGKNYVKIHDGDIEFYKFLGGAQRLHRSLKRWENGTATNGQWTEIPGYWLAEPKLLLTPASIDSCKDARMVDQKLTVKVAELEQFSPSRWKFKPEATLSWLPGGSFKNTVDFRVTGKSETELSPEYQTSENCVQVTVGFQVSSKKNTSTDGEFHQRLVDVCLYVDGQQAGMTTVSLGSSTLFTKGTVSSGVLAAGTHRVQIKAVGRDSGQTFVLHAPAVDYVAVAHVSSFSGTETTDPVVVPPSASGAFRLYDGLYFMSCRYSVTDNKQGSLSYTFSPSSPGEGWEFDKHEFSASCSLGHYSGSGGSGFAKLTLSDGQQFVAVNEENFFSFSITSRTKDLSVSLSADLQTSAHAGAWFDIGASAASVVTTWKKETSSTSTEIITTPVTPIPVEITSAIFESVTEILGGDSQLAAGTVNYIAIGE